MSRDTRFFFCFQWLVSNLRHAKSITPLETGFVANSRPWYPNWMGIKSKNLYMYFWKASQITTETHQLPICSIIIISLSIARSWLHIITYKFLTCIISYYHINILKPMVPELWGKLAYQWSVAISATITNPMCQESLVPARRGEDPCPSLTSSLEMSSGNYNRAIENGTL